MRIMLLENEPHTSTAKIIARDLNNCSKNLFSSLHPLPMPIFQFVNSGLGTVHPKNFRVRFRVGKRSGFGYQFSGYPGQSADGAELTIIIIPSLIMGAR